MGQKMLTDANRRLVFVPDLEDYHAPKVSELSGAGVVELSCNVTADAFSLGAVDDDEITDPALCASSNSTTPGRANYEANTNLFRWKETEDDVAWTTFTGKGLGGYLVQRIGQIEDGEKAHEVEFKADDEVQVYQVISGTPKIMSPSDAGYEKFGVKWSVQDQVDERAVVADGA